MANLFILTGPSCSGKTTLIEALRQKDYQVVPEVQMAEIARRKEQLGGVEEWKKWLRNPDGTINKPHFSEFMHTCMALQIQQEEIAFQRAKDGTVFLDRSVMDGFSFLLLREIFPTRYTMHQVTNHVAKIGGYTGVFMCQILEDEFSKRPQNGRVITLEEAKKFDDINHEVYIGNNTVNLSALPITERVNTILHMLPKMVSPVYKRGTWTR